MICKKKKKTARIFWSPKGGGYLGFVLATWMPPRFRTTQQVLQIFEEGTCCLSPSLPSPTTMWGIARELAAHATDAEGGNAGGGEESSSFKQQIEIPLAVSAFFLSVVARGSRILFSFFDPGVVVLVLRRVNHPLPLCVGLGCVGTYCASWVATRESAIRENLVGNVFCCCQGSDNGQPAMAVSVVLVQQAPPKSGAKG